MQTFDENLLLEGRNYIRKPIEVLDPVSVKKIGKLSVASLFSISNSYI